MYVHDPLVELLGSSAERPSMDFWRSNAEIPTDLPRSNTQNTLVSIGRRIFLAPESRNSSYGSTTFERTKHSRFYILYRLEDFFGARTLKFLLRIYCTRAHKTPSFLYRKEDFFGARTQKFLLQIYRARAHKTPSFYVGRRIFFSLDRIKFY